MTIRPAIGAHGPKRPDAAASLPVRHLRRQAGSILFASVLIGALLFLVTATKSVASPAAVQPAASTVSAKIPVPAAGTGAYVGALYNPNGDNLTAADPLGGRAAATSEISGLSNILSASGTSPLSIVVVDQDWSSKAVDKNTDMATPTWMTQLDQIAAMGAVPLIRWQCGLPDAKVASGNAGPDGDIDAVANELASYGLPVLLDWFPDADLGTNTDCLGTDTSNQAKNYKLAYQHIWNQFQTAGATNVSFVWSVDPANVGGAQTWANFYPGPKYVDWISAEPTSVVSTAPPSSGPDDRLANQFTAWYHAVNSYGKPLMMSDVGVSNSQTSYLQTVRSDLQTAFPQVRAFTYLDAPPRPARYPNGNPVPSPVLDPETLPNLEALDASLAPARSPATLTISLLPRAADPAPVSPVLGEAVKLSASVSAADQGGTVSFSTQAGPIDGCAAVPVHLDAVCSTSSLALGTNSITARYNGDVSFGPADSAPFILTVGTTPKEAAPPGIPGPNSAYLGAWIQPVDAVSAPNTDSPAVDEELQNLQGFNSGLGAPRNLSMVHVYQSFSEPAPSYVLRQVAAQGAIPIIDWRCGDYDANVAAGDDDGTIIAYADQLEKLGLPVFLRWYWEPNIVTKDFRPATHCLTAPPGSPAGTLSGAAGYVAAFQHIQSIFRQQGATNVSFVWSMSSGATDQDLMSYFPGAAYVDWIAVDGYWRKDSSSVLNVLPLWYRYFGSFGIPMMISETGATGGVDQTSSQSKYLNSLFDGVQTGFGEAPGDSQIKAVSYFDAAGSHNYRLVGSPGADTKVDSTVDPGWSTFQTIANSAFFQPTRLPTAFAGAHPVTATPESPVAGQEVALTATVQGADQGGSLTFSVGGTPISGCEGIEVSVTTTCETDQLPVGPNDEISVSYSGDAAVEGSSTTFTQQILPSTAPVRALPKVPTSPTVYLGAWVNPGGGGTSAEIKQLASFNSTLERPLSIVSLYQPWQDPSQPDNVPIPSYELRSVVATGAIPMINWDCGDTDANVESGAYDKEIRAFGNELASLHSPVFLRWGYAPNATTSAHVQSCLGSGGPAEYQAAYEHIHDLILSVGATNVSFVWTVALAGDTSNLMSYYPGSAYVDWIAADGDVTPDLLNSFSHSTTISAAAVTKQLFSTWYSQFQAFGKPLMISSTGAPAASQTQAQDTSQSSNKITQADYLNYLGDHLQTDFPAVRALVYMDGTSQSGTAQYALDPDGLAAFQSLDADQMFQPTRDTSTVSLTLASSQVMAGRAIQAAATAPDSDGGGSVTYQLDHQTVSDCVGLPQGWTCPIGKVAAGKHVVTASFSGDANYMPSDSGTVEATAVEAAVPPPGAGSGNGSNPDSTAGDSSFGQGHSTYLPYSQSGHGTFDGLPTIGLLGAMNYLPIGISAHPENAEPAEASALAKGTGSPLIPAALNITSASVVTQVIVLSALAIALGGGAYIFITWQQDRKRRRLTGGALKPR